jgi:hypothetical protein
MREERAAARDLPAQRRAEAVGLDGDEHEAGLAREVPGQRAGKRVAGREMHEAVGAVDGRSLGLAGCLEVRPFVVAEQLVDQHVIPAA